MSPHYQDKRVLVTGADGFIGSHLSVRLAGLGAKATCLIGPRRHLWRLEAVKDNVFIVEGDAKTSSRMREVFAEHRPEIVFNAAAVVNTARTLVNAAEVIENNYGIAESVISAATETGVRRLVQFGSIEEYGSARVPFAEDMREEPISPYSLGKTMATQYALTMGKLAPMEVCVVRPAATYGPAQGAVMLIPNIIKSCLEKKDFDMNPGEQLRDFIYVDDLVEGVLACGAHEAATGQIINLGSGRGVKVREVVEQTLASMGNPIRVNFGVQPYRPLDFMEFYMSTEKAKKLLGWEAKTSLEDGIAQTTAWYLKHASFAFGAKVRAPL